MGSLFLLSFHDSMRDNSLSPRGQILGIYLSISERGKHLCWDISVRLFRCYPCDRVPNHLSPSLRRSMQW